MSIESALITAVVALASAVGVLWKIERGNVRELNKEMKECRRDRLELWKTIAAMEARTCDVPGCNLRRTDRRHQRRAEEAVQRLEAQIKDMPKDNHQDPPRGHAATA